METLITDRTSEIRRNKKELEEKLKVKIGIAGKKVSFEGEAMNEYEASIVLDAIDFGFSAPKALSLKEPDMIFRKLSIKDFTRRKNLKDVKARIIGTEGKTKRTIENITGCEIEIQLNSVGIIGSSLSMDEAVTAIKNLIRGSKQSNVYSFLEKMNANKRKYIYDDLGLKRDKEADEDRTQDKDRDEDTNGDDDLEDKNLEDQKE